jgi:Amidohydrolase
MTEKAVRRQSVSRRTLLSGTVGLLGGAALSFGAALAQNTAPASTGAPANSPAKPRYPDPAWLAPPQREEIIEPALEIVDSHHHLWDRPGFSLINCSSTDLETGYRPYVETCIAAFGVDRSMFESNFPPDGASSSYSILWNAFKRLAAGSSASEKASLFSGTAKRVYRLA